MQWGTAVVISIGNGSLCLPHDAAARELMMIAQNAGSSLGIIFFFGGGGGVIIPVAYLKVMVYTNEKH